MTVAATLYEWLLFLHIVAAMAWVGGLVTLMALGAQAVRGGGPDARARFVASLRVVGPRVLLPAMVAVVGIGVWMVLDSEGWDFGQTWVQPSASPCSLAPSWSAPPTRAAWGSPPSATRCRGRGDALCARHLARWSWGYRAILRCSWSRPGTWCCKPGIRSVSEWAG